MTQVKICGVTTAETIDTAIAAGADYIGFVFFDKSPRNLEIDTAASLCKHARGRAHRVALVVDPDDDMLREVVRQVKPDILQLHGHETPQRVAQITSDYGVDIWKAVAVASSEDVARARAYADCTELILFDAKPPQVENALPGGNGLSFDWRILSGQDHEGSEITRPYALAGGLTPANVADAVSLLGPDILDVSSGVESSPGIKDTALIERFIRTAKAAKQRA